MRVITANVNGIRAAQRRGGLGWLADQQADVWCLQEVRADEPTLRGALDAAGLAHWHHVHTEGSAKGRAGVAVVTAAAPTTSALELGPAQFAQSGRWAQAVVETASGPVTVVSVYVHTGQADTPKQDEKYAFLDAVTQRIEQALRDGEELLLCGDLNIAHTDTDLKNAKGNIGKAGVLPQEREFLDRWAAAGLVDVHRALSGPGPGPYTWWSWRGKAFDNDAGWRIDYQWATPQLAARAELATVGRAPAYDQRWSDHAALVVDYRD